ncbi:cytochrome b [Pseudomonas sp. MAFF 302030]|uniref:Cytochrome b n=1 Tax=Pseudomonas morbosilactucae TaxID=2938197 RepID=A0A9X2C8N0_9PSED|nr:cytochrome b [Pseudomonas morbosilactucae]MCK9800945.1 cytochrome b [Pseudomonas morbosilactucae]
MTNASAAQRYTKLSMTLHWLMLVLFVGVYACIELKGMLPKGHALKVPLLGVHALFGLGIFALVWVRLLGRLKPRPAIVPTPPAWQNVLARVTHLALYLLMIVTPALAWLMLSAAGKPVPYFGFMLPSPLAVDTELAKQLKEWHELIGNAGYALIGLHACAGLFHHYWVHDNTLTRMLPRRF